MRAPPQHPEPPPRIVLRRLRQWMLNTLSIRQRLSLWYMSLLALILILFSITVYTLAQQQLQGSVDTDIRTRAQGIAAALEGEGFTAPSTQTGAPSATTTPAPTESISPAATATAPATSTSTSTGAPTATVQATPVPTPNPQTRQKIEQQLNVKVPQVLYRLDLGFEVLDTYGHPQFIAPSLPDSGLPLNTGDINAVLGGAPGTSYVARANSVKNPPLLDIYVEPIVLKTPAGLAANPLVGVTTATGTPAATGTPGASATTSATPTPGTSDTTMAVRWVVLVAKPLDDVNKTLATLGKLLAIGDLIAVILAALGGWAIAEGVLRPIASVTRTAGAIAQNANRAGLGTRVRYSGPRDEVGELVATFNEMLAALERVSTAQRRFVADASHELRAPLTTIKGSLDFLRRARDLPPDERDAVLEDAYAESERMAALVSDLLLLARADAAASGTYGASPGWLDDQLRGRREPVELDQLAMDIFRHGRAQLQARHKDLRLAVRDLEPVTVLCDPGQLRQLVLILLDNAIKYTPTGGRISISVTRVGDRAAFSVSDTGIGIEPAVRPHIFERFYRADQARERDEHGSGLGLAIAKWIVDSHAGEIMVESEPGGGSCFTVLLPALRHTTEHITTRPQQVRVRRRKLRSTGAPGAGQRIAPLARLAKSVSRPRGWRDMPGDSGARRAASAPASSRTESGAAKPPEQTAGRALKLPHLTKRPDVRATQNGRDHGRQPRSGQPK